MASPQADTSPAASTSGAAGDLAERLSTEIAALDNELTEIAMLVAQAQSEATRHEQRRVQTTEKLASGVNLPPADVAALNTQLVSLTRRAAVMEAQVDVLEGKRKTLGRYRDSLLEIAETYGGIKAADDGPGGVDGAGRLAVGDGADSPMSRIVLNAQEDLRREIARAMHDGPAQSLTNIVLQAQIVERLLVRDPDGARGELRLLVAMVQHTLEATKAFIFDVRPMVLDDLGLVPTLRRATRERGRRSGVPVAFESLGQDRRLSMDLESGLFRMLDEALAAYLAGSPDRVTLRLDWGDQLEGRIAATRAVAERVRSADAAEVPASGVAADLPPALAAMMEERRSDERDAVQAAIRESIVALPAATWREIQSRAASIGIVAELLSDGGELRIVADIPALPESSAG